MTMPCEPLFTVAADFLQAAATGGEVCLPWAIVAGVPSALVVAVVFQTRRVVELTRRQEQQYDELVGELYRAYKRRFSDEERHRVS